MKWALVLALVLCCGTTLGDAKSESGESWDNLLARNNLRRNGEEDPNPEDLVTDDKDAKDPPVTDDKITENPPVTDAKITENSPVTDDTITENPPVTDDTITENPPVTDDTTTENSPVTDDTKTDNPVTDKCKGIECKNGIVCVDGKCPCTPGLTGVFCETVEGCAALKPSCDKIGKPCIYDQKKTNKATCNCGEDKKFDGKECKETCDDDAKKCAFGMTCKPGDGYSFCDCKSGLTGDRCDVITDCQPSGIYDKCTETGGNCTYTGTDSICICKNNKAYDTKSKTCRDCECGDEAVSCQFNKGVKICICKPNYEDNNGTCDDCDCGELKKEAKSCKFNNGAKVCDCVSMYASKDGTCTECKCGENTSKGCVFKDDVKNCTCKDNNSQKEDVCEACDCGTNGKCSFDDNGQQKCTCSKKYEVKNGKCAYCYCGGKGQCSFDGENKVCSCEEGYAEDKDNPGECKACDCGSNGECGFENKQKKCSCNEGYKEKDGKCIGICDSDDDCEHDTKCKGTEESGFFCDCGSASIFTGDKCEKIVACETGDLRKCEESGGECKYSKTAESKAVCNCGGGEKALDKKKQICRKKCEKNENCEHGAKCDEHFCDCLPGTSGDDCSTVTGCVALKEKCEEISAKCIYDVKATIATCKCDNEDLIYKDNNCTAKWCETKPCKATDSKCDYGFGSAFCKCTKVGQYYNYASDKCIDIDKCPLVPCKINEYCKDDGTCACNENLVKDKDGCKDERKKLCASTPCYSKANCSEGEVIGTVKCECPPDTYFNPSSKTCDDGTCFLPDKRENCKAPCPYPLKREKGECVAKEEDKCKDEKDCGPFGYCFLKKNQSTCICIKDFAVLDREKGVCILNKEKACVSNKTLSDNANKCDCSGMYKESTNGITCDVMTCGDEAAQNDCQSKGAFCVDVISKKQRIRYDCKCPAGRKLVKEKGCVDICSDKDFLVKCSKNQQTCYLNEKGEGTCKCPPGFKEIKTGVGNNQKTTCQPNAEFTYLLKELPIMSSSFLNEDKTVNKVKLNEYVIKSMKAVSSQNFVFASVQDYSTSDDVLLCNVWLNFNNQDAEQEVKRWRSQVVNNNGSLVLPPSLILSSEKLDNVKYEKLEFCSPIVAQTACGEGSNCEKNECTCKDGYRVIGPTVEVIGGNTVLRCEDVDECLENTHTCKSNSKCTNTNGGYFCKCDPGFHKKNQNESEECVELCSPNPCTNGECEVKENKVQCNCKVGFKGSYCTESDDKLKQAQHSTKVVGAVLGTILAVTFVAIIAYIVKLKKNSYSEDFSAAPRDNSEMAERSRPLRGVSNRGYQ